MEKEERFEKNPEILPEERPIIAFPAVIIIGIIFLSLFVALSLLFLPLEITISLFVGIFGLIIITLSPYLGLLIFIAAHFTQPARFFIALQPLHLIRILSLGTLFSWFLHMMITRKFKIVKSLQSFFILSFAFLVLFSSFQYPDYSLPFFMEVLKIFILFFLIVNLIKSEELLRVFIWVLVIVSMIISLIGINQYFHGVGIVYADMGITRITGTMGDPNDFALHLIIILPLIFYLFWENKSFWIKTILIASFCLLMLAIIFTFSRGGSVGLGVVMFLLFFQFIFKKQSKKWLYFLVLILFISMLIPFIPTKYWERLKDINILEDEAVKGRIHAWRTGWEMMKDKPITGMGLATFKYFYYPYAPLGIDPRRVIVAHNMFISVGAEIGFPGLLFFISIITYAFKDLWRAYNNFKIKENISMVNMSQALGISLIGYCACSVFLSVEWLPALWILISLSTTLKFLSRSDYKGELT